VADNIGYTPGTGATVAADEIGGVLHQRIKLGIGADGVAVDVSAANPMPITASTPLAVTGGLTDEQLRATPVPISGGSAIDPYALNDFLDGDPLYLGKVKADGAWLLQKFSSTTGEMRYANVSNNAGVTTYASAWSGKAGLTYGLFQTLTGV
jgi:hypothetical protein